MKVGICSGEEAKSDDSHWKMSAVFQLRCWMGLPDATLARLIWLNASMSSEKVTAAAAAEVEAEAEAHNSASSSDPGTLGEREGRNALFILSVRNQFNHSLGFCDAFDRSLLRLMHSVVHFSA